ncbi:hypothetical protein DH2020_005395 [Rehmannia glutinosa]|uniref:Uncharacterized protein n=1 Tax=Rehmannia glutinosa TaxID=99300 RepID=A0ABR0XFY9_REHGL
MIYSYRHVFKVFAARLSADEAKAMENKEGFISARPERELSLHTTHSPNFLGLNQNTGFWQESNYGKGVIIESWTRSFPEPPRLAMKECLLRLLNGKESANSISPRVQMCLAMLMAAFVGIAPLAHLAIYKVCSIESDILAAMDTAVDDGVDILSLSLGGSSFNFYNDFIALGAFIAMEKGILPIDFPKTLLPLVYAGMLNTSDSDIRFCTVGSLNNTDVRGKIVVCEIGGFITRIAKGRAVKDAGGAGMIIVNPASGPNTASRGILKPDILGPGVNILAAWPVSVENNTDTNSTFNIISGTSMSCPHLSGVAALLKSAHPDWYLPANVFATGSGHVNPSKANDPGLVYDILPTDYTPYLCGLNYTNRQVGSFLRRRVNCSEESSILEGQLNYPSFAVTFGRFQPTTQTYNRTVTNVGDPSSSYTVEIVPPPGIDVIVEPSKLDFVEVNQELQYQVTFSRPNSTTNIGYVQGHIKWNSSKHSVRSPIAVTLQMM